MPASKHESLAIGGSGNMPSREFLIFIFSEFDSNAILESNL